MPTAKQSAALADDLDIDALSHEERVEMLHLMELDQHNSAISAEERARLEEIALLEADLSAFVKAAWHVVQPGIVLDWSWHYDYIAEHLTLCYQRKTRRLIINIPPRTLKSIFVSVMFPPWVWAKNPAHSFLCASYAANLSTEHSVMRRALIESEWYQERWGDRVWLARDQNEKTKFRNNHQAQMSATSVGGTATGLGGNTNILDDGMNPKQAASDAETLATHTWFDTTWRSRLNNPAEDALIVIEQRTSERDVTGHLLEADDLLAKEGRPREWTHIAIPLECDEDGGEEEWRFPISGRVVERRIGEVLQPKRFPPDVVAATKIRRLVWSTQYQQRPSPLEGNMIKRSEVRYYGGRDPLTGEIDPQLPAKFDLLLTSADCAFKDEKTSDYVCVMTIGVKGPDRVILEVTNKHLDEPATRTEILRQRAAWGSTLVLVEDKANGSAVIKSLRRKITGLIAIEPMGGKLARFVASCGEWQSGNWFISRTAAWAEPFVDQITKFPNAAHDDQADAMTQACIYLQGQPYMFGLSELLKQQDDMANKQKRVPVKAKPANATPEDAKAALAPDDDPEPEIAAPAVIGEESARKIDRSSLTKPEIDDSTPHCGICNSTIVQRVPGGGKRCGQCGAQWGQTSIIKPATTEFNGRDGLVAAFRK